MLYGSDQTLQKRQRAIATPMSPEAPESPRGTPQTFAAMRSAGMARPAPQAAVPPGVRESVAAGVANPGAYGAPQAMDTFNRLNTALSEQFGLARRGVDQQAARRGIFDSSIAVGQLGDLATQQARAQSDLAGQIAERAALSNQADRQSANTQALQLAGMDQQAGQFGVQQELARILGLGGLDLQRDQLGQQGRQFDASLGLQRDQLGQQDRQFSANQQLQRDQMLQALAVFLGLPTGSFAGDVGGGGADYGMDGVTYSERPTAAQVYTGNMP
jgi:hypothetical protein